MRNVTHSSVMYVDSFTVIRDVSVSREELEDGRVQFVVRATDRGREKAFINRTFTQYVTAIDFAEKLRTDSYGS